MSQLIQEPTHILNSSSSCIDLIFISQPNLVMESGIHSPLHSNCHHRDRDDRDPPWLNKEIKKLMLEKNLALKSYCCSNKSMFLFKKFKALQYQLNISIEESKEKYYTKLSSRLADPLTSPKTYWSILKTFLNNKKIPCIPPLFHENKFITDSKKKLNYLTIFL